jgi:hypothetical protein
VQDGWTMRFAGLRRRVVCRRSSREEGASAWAATPPLSSSLANEQARPDHALVSTWPIGIAFHDSCVVHQQCFKVVHEETQFSEDPCMEVRSIKNRISGIKKKILKHMHLRDIVTSCM